MQKIIVSLRNPVDRAFSHFKMDVECNLSRMKKKMLIADAFHERMTDEILFLACAGLLKVNTNNTLDSSHAWEQGKGMLSYQEVHGIFCPKKQNPGRLFLGIMKHIMEF